MHGVIIGRRGSSASLARPLDSFSPAMLQAFQPAFSRSSRNTEPCQSHGWGAAMIKRSSQVLGGWFLLWDLILTGLAWLGAYYLRFTSGLIPIYKPAPDANLCWI